MIEWMKILKKGTEGITSSMIYILLIFVCPLLFILFLVYILNVFYFIELIIPGLIVFCLIMTLAVELKSFMLGVIAFVWIIYWMFYVMNKIDKWTSEDEEKRKRKYMENFSVRK